ncbi:hypothetical protein TNCV_2885031 [Trichonephila clavipes]|nr:hypothetical protein TNCV_2885031 [Trichonephila clavipes]
MPAGWLGWFVADPLHPRLRVRPRPKSVDFHDVENQHTAKDLESEPAKKAIQSGDSRRTFGQCVSRVVVHYPVEIWLWPNPEGKEGQLAPTPRRCSASCLKYRQCVLEECESDIQYPPYHNTWCRTSVAVHNATVQHLLSTVSQTRIRPSWCCRQMRDSSAKTTSFHSAAHILLSSPHWRRRRLWFYVKGRPSNGRLADRQLYCKRRRMVRKYTE